MLSLLKGVIKPDHVMDSKFTLQMVGMIPITVITIGDIDEEMDASETPDRSRRSGGRTKPVAFDITIPMHHATERAAMEVWYRMGKDPINPAYKKVGALIGYTQSGVAFVKYTFTGMWLTKRGIPGFDRGGEGAVQMLTYGCSADEVV